MWLLLLLLLLLNCHVRLLLLLLLLNCHVRLLLLLLLRGPWRVLQTQQQLHLEVLQQLQAL